MPAQYFTLAEANERLSHIKPLMGELLSIRAHAVRQSQSIQETLQLSSDIGGPIFSDLTQDFNKMEALIEEIEAYGCVIKDLNVGLLDFLAQKNGRDVYLCWRYGEDKIEYYHELHTGFKGRRPF